MSVLRWDECDLEARLCRALDLAKTTVGFFAKTGYADRESPLYSFGPEKPVAETAMLIYAASACRHRSNVSSKVHELARILVPHARSDRVFADIALHPALAFTFAVPHVLLTRLGYPDSSFDDFLKSCLSSDAINGHERTPLSSLERRWIRSLWTGEKPDGAWQATLRASVLSSPLDILGGLREDVYALTHLIFYCTDFGFRSWRLPRRRSVILAEASSLLAKYLDSEDYDLSGELLLSWPFTGGRWSPSAVFALRVLASVEQEVGILPCGNVNVARLNRLEGEERTRYALGTAYHTAYVMGFLCAACLRSDRLPPVKIAGPRVEPSCLTRLRGYIEDDHGHWHSEFSRLSDDEQQVLTPFILDIGLVQNCRRRNYVAMKELLTLGYEYGLDGSPLCRQATDLLQRLASCSIALSASGRPIGNVAMPAEPAVSTQLASSAV